MFLSPNSVTGRGAALRRCAAARHRVPAAVLAAVVLLAVWAAPAAAQPTAAPDWVSVTEPTAGHLRVEWSQVADATGYELSHNGTRDSRRTNQGASRQTTAAGIRSFTVIGLDIGRTYYLYVRATNAGGNGPWSALRSITLVGPPPSAPQALAAARVSEHVWRLSWSAPAQAGAGITGYTVALAASSLTDPDDITVTTPTAANVRTLDVRLPPSSENYIYVRASTVAGAGPWAPLIVNVDDRPGDGVIAPVAGDSPGEVWAPITDNVIEWAPTIIVLFFGVLIFGFTLLLLAAGSRRAIGHLVGLVRGDHLSERARNDPADAAIRRAERRRNRE